MMTTATKGSSLLMLGWICDHGMTLPIPRSLAAGFDSCMSQRARRASRPFGRNSAGGGPRSCEHTSPHVLRASAPRAGLAAAPAGLRAGDFFLFFGLVAAGPVSRHGFGARREQRRTGQPDDGPVARLLRPVGQPLVFR